MVIRGYEAENERGGERGKRESDAGSSLMLVWNIQILVDGRALPCLPACLLAYVPTSLCACVPVCLLACLLACLPSGLPAGLQACSLSGMDGTDR